MAQTSRSGSSSGWQTFGLYRALHKGDIITAPLAKTKEAIIKETTNLMADRFDLDADVVADLLLDRESLMPTALGEGFAIPHTRDFLLQGEFDAVYIVFPKEPLDWGALDGRPVHTLFFLFACDDKHHLNLLAKIAHLTSDPEASKFLATKPDKETFLSFIKDWELQLQEKRP
jgi:PTS system nitrogen regulatory IIA component